MTNEGVVRELPAARPSRRLLLRAATAGLVLAAAGVAVWLLFGRGSGSASTATTTAASTTLATVERRDLAETETFSGTLGYTRSRTLVAQAAGTITWLPPEGSIRERGQALYRLDGKPVVLLYGTVPSWRAMSDEVSIGQDVRQLEWNLVVLGFDPERDVVIDGDYNWATAAAVERWQEALGLEETGAVDLGAVVFLPGPSRLGQRSAFVGGSIQPGAQVMVISSKRQQVVVQLEATKQDLAAVGRRVTVGLPDGSSVPGRIAAVGKVAQAPQESADAGGTAASSSPTVEVEIDLLRVPRTQLDQAPVDVELTTETRRDVLVAPVTALVALLGGGYAVEVQRGDTSQLVAVTPGLYADGYVELLRGVRQGDRVVVPR